MYSRITILAFCLTFCVYFCESSELCRSQQAQQNCGECIKQHPDCAWCRDPSFSGSHRCDHNESLACQRDFIYQPKIVVDLHKNRPLGEAMTPEGQQQLQPQIVKIRMKPGEQSSFEMNYLHLDEPRSIYVLNSEATSQGLKIDYKVRCKEGLPHEAGDKCNDVNTNDKIEFIVTITLQSCKTNGDAVVSIGVSQHRQVVAVYITPICMCPCEKFDEREQRSQHCMSHGNLVCGACVCDQGWLGKKCGCQQGESTGDDQSCKRSPDAPVCEGNGQCSCGMCECNQGFEGVHCECDNSKCPTIGGQQCSAHGKCACGSCVCQSGWQGHDCGCSTDKAMCMNGNNEVCSGAGMCKCGECKCEEGATGTFCEIGAPIEEPKSEEPKSEEPEPSEESETEKMKDEEIEGSIGGCSTLIGYRLFVLVSSLAAAYFHGF